MTRYLELFRSKNILIAIFAMALMISLTGTGQINWQFIPGVFIVIFIMTGANVINDLQDISTDYINRPDKPLVKGDISLKSAQWIAFLSFFMAIILCFLIPPLAMRIAFFAVLILIFYTSVFKPMPWMGNFFVALISALLFIYAGALLGAVSTGIIPAILAFSIHFIREMVKDLEDIEGDRQSGMSTLPIRLGNIKVQKYIRNLALLFIFFLLLLISQRIYGNIFAGIVSVFVIPYFIYLIWEMRKIKLNHLDYHRHSQYLKIEMFIGLVSMGIGQWFMNS